MFHEPYLEQYVTDRLRRRRRAAAQYRRARQARRKDGAPADGREGAGPSCGPIPRHASGRPILAA